MGYQISTPHESVLDHSAGWLVGVPVNPVPTTHSVSRSLDNQVYTAAVSPARDEKASYVAWGHSTLVNPWYVHSTTHGR